MTLVQATTYTIDPAHSSVHFSVRHMMLSKVRGSFPAIAGTIALSPDGAPIAINADIEVASITTGEAQRDGHLKSEDFFHAEKYTHMRFASTSITPKSGQTFAVAGDLEIHGISKPVVLETEAVGRLTDPWGNDRIAYEAKTRINRKDFGFTFNQALETGGLLVGDDIDIELQIQAIAKP